LKKRTGQNVGFSGAKLNDYWADENYLFIGYYDGKTEKTKNRPAFLGPRGGVLYINSNGNPTYLNELKQINCIRFID